MLTKTLAHELSFLFLFEQLKRRLYYWSLNATFKLLTETCWRVPVIYLPDEWRFDAYDVIDYLTWKSYYENVESLIRFGKFWERI